MNPVLARRIALGVLFLTSMLFLFSGIYSYTQFSAYELTREYRGAYFAVAGIMAIFLGAALFNLFLHITVRKGSFKAVLIMTIVIGLPCLIYGQHMERTRTIVNVGELIEAPVVGGYDTEGYIVRDASLNPEKVNAYLNSIEDDTKRARVAELLDTASLQTITYEDRLNRIVREPNCLCNGDEIVAELDFNQYDAQDWHISVDDFVTVYEVDELEESPYIDGYL